MTEDETEPTGSARVRGGTGTTGTSCWNKFCASQRLKKALGHLGLFAALTLYTILGGIVFRELEYPVEVDKLSQLASRLQLTRNHLLLKIADIPELNHTTSDPEKRRNNLIKYIEKDLKRYQDAVEEVAQEGVGVEAMMGVGGQGVDSSSPTSTEQLAKWSHVQAIFFASTVLTTIGYGNIVPVTMGGRCFCVVFALIGIPLAVTVIGDVGCLLATWAPVLWSGGWPRPIESRPSVKSLVTALAALALLLAFLSVGALLFVHLEEEWDFFESFYFCFITMTTIGFGDLVPRKAQYMLLCTLYILAGLSITSTIIELVRQEYAKSWKRVQALAEALRRLGEASAQGADVTVLQADLKRVLAAAIAGGGGPNAAENGPKDGDNWEKAFSNIVGGIVKPKQEPKIIQVVIYETSV